MTAILFPALFTASAMLAIHALAATWRQYGASALALREELRSCSEWRDVSVTVREITVRPGGARILRPDFKAPDFRGPQLPPVHVLPEAA